MAGPDDTSEFPDLSRHDANDSSLGSEDLPEFEGYKLLDKLGEGGMGTVWRAIQLSTSREVALKAMSSRVFGSHKAQIRFECEVELSARLQHPNIARVYDSGLHQGLYFYAMELIDGEHLDDYVERQKLNHRQVMELMGTVSQAVAYAHQQGIIHRDLKPSNILITSDGQPHILDFGLAKAIFGTDSDKGASVDGDMIGTLPYMSPEQARGQSELVDVRTDVYALGIITYHMITGQYPYDVTGTAYELMENIQKTMPVRPRGINPKIDPDIEAILLTALAKETEERYQSAIDLKGDIENWLQGLPIRARSISTLYVLRKLITKHRYASGVLGLVLLIVLGFSSFSFYLFLVTQKAQNESSEISEQWISEANTGLLLGQQATFTVFLKAWHNDKAKLSQKMAMYFAQDSREKKAAVFLLQNRSLSDKEPLFRQNISDNDQWFAEYAIGEYYLKSDNVEKALDAYQRSIRLAKDVNNNILPADDWLIVNIRARIHELTAPVETQNTE